MSKGKKKFPLLPFQVCGKDWVAFFCSTRFMNKRYGKDTLAVSECDAKQLYFRTKNLSYETAVHEIYHAYIWELGARSMKLDVDQMEELGAEMFSKYADVVTLTGRLIIKTNEGLK